MPPKLKAVARRRWLFLVLIPLLSGLAVWFVTPAQPTDAVESFKAERTIAIDLTNGTPSFTDAEQASLLATVGAVPAAAAETLGYRGNPNRLAQDLDVETDSVTYTIKMSTVRPTPADAVEYVDAFATAFVEVVNNRGETERQAQIQRLTDQRDQASQQLAAFNTQNAEALANPFGPPDEIRVQQATLQQTVSTLTQQIDALQITSATPQTTYRVLGRPPAERVAPPTISVPRQRPQRVALTMPFAFLLAIALVYLLEKLSPRIDVREDIATVSDLPLLSEVPIRSAKSFRKAEVDPSESFEGAYAESYRALRSSLEYASGSESKGSPPVIMVVSAVPGEGKSSTAAHLAMAYAEKGSEVLILGADFRKPTLHRMFSVPREPGLAELASKQGVEPGDVVQPTATPGVSLVTSGRPTSVVAPLIGSAFQMIEWAQERGKVVIVDTAPILGANDATELFRVADHAVIVLRAAISSVTGTRSMLDVLSQYDVPTLGFVLIDSPSQRSNNYFYRYYRYYQADESDESSNGIHPPLERPKSGRPAADVLRDLEAAAAADGSDTTGRDPDSGRDPDVVPTNEESDLTDEPASGLER